MSIGAGIFGALIWLGSMVWASSAQISQQQALTADHERRLAKQEAMSEAMQREQRQQGDVLTRLDERIKVMSESVSEIKVDVKSLSRGKK